MDAGELASLFEELVFAIEMVTRDGLRDRNILLGERMVLAGVSQIIIGRLRGEGGDRLELAHILINSINKLII